jgi:predicted ATPase/DNA-binding SARP family transcriptional activator
MRARGEGELVLSVSVLGSLRAVKDGAPLAIGSRQQRALLAALALRHPRAVSVDELVDALWDDDPPSQASATLQTYVSRLRAVVGNRAIALVPAGYRLTADAEVDVHAARDSLADVEAQLSPDPAGAVELATAAIERWDGRALAEFADSAWFAPIAVGLDELRDNLVEALADGLVRCGRSVEAVEILEGATRSHPFRERSQLLLVRALGETGRATEALRVADRYRRDLRETTGLEPGAQLAAVEAAILAGELAPVPVAPVRPTAHRAVLARPTSLIGRDRDLATLRTAVEEARLVTVLGTGGVGKTRLVAELLATWPDSHSPPAVVELASVDRPDVADALAAAVGYRAGQADADTLADVLGHDDALIVLDNCEHVLDSVRPIVRALLDSCPRVSFITTSRVRLALPDEQLLALQPLPTAGEHPAAVELFTCCLRRARSGTELEATDDDLRQLCQQLDGIPLAIELAAARAAALGVGALTARLGESPELLNVPFQAAHSRHASPNALVSWSYDLLPDDARRLLAAISAFEGEFDLDAVEYVGTGALDLQVGPVFGHLVDSCMVALGSTPGRFRLLQLVRHFSRQRLHDDPDEPAVRRNHAGWVALQIETVNAACGAGEAEISDHLDRLRPDIRAAHQWAIANDETDAVVALADALAGPLLYRPDSELTRMVFDSASRVSGPGVRANAALLAAGARAGYQMGALDAARGLAEQALVVAGPDDEQARGRALHALGVVALYEGRFDDAGAAFTASADETAATPADRCDALGGAALAACYAGQLEPAAVRAAQHRALAEVTRSNTALAFADYIDGERALTVGETDRGMERLRESADRAWAARAPFVWGIASTVLVAALVRNGQRADAVEQLPVLLRRWRRTATWPQLWMSLRLAAEVMADAGADAQAATVLAGADADPDAPIVTGADAEHLTEMVACIEARLGTVAFAAANARAGVIGRGQILDLAISALDDLSAR